MKKERKVIDAHLHIFGHCEFGDRLAHGIGDEPTQEYLTEKYYGRLGIEKGIVMGNGPLEEQGKNLGEYFYYSAGLDEKDSWLKLEQIDEMATWKDQRLNEAKEILAYELTSMVHGKEEADKAQNAARALFSGAADTEHMPTTQLTEADLTDGSIGILTVMVKAGLAASNGEARRLVTQGGVLVDGEKVAAPTVSFTAEQLANGIVIKKGKKIYHKVTL